MIDYREIQRQIEIPPGSEIIAQLRIAMQEMSDKKQHLMSFGYPLPSGVEAALNNSGYSVTRKGNNTLIRDEILSSEY